MRNREAEYDSWLSARSPRESHGTIHEGRSCRAGAPREGLGNGCRAANSARCTHIHGGTVGSEHDVWVEQREKRVEVAAARGSRVALPQGGRAPQWERSRQRGRRTCRAARTRPVRREPVFRAPPAARDQPSRRVPLRAPGRGHPRGTRSARAGAHPEIPRAAACASAACPDTRARPPWSAIRPGSRRRLCRTG
jgi:hypothetical protein